MILLLLAAGLCACAIEVGSAGHPWIAAFLAVAGTFALIVYVVGEEEE